MLTKIDAGTQSSPLMSQFSAFDPKKEVGSVENDLVIRVCIVDLERRGIAGGAGVLEEW